MAKFIVLKTHDTAKGLALKGSTIEYNEVASLPLLKAGIIAKPVKMVIKDNSELIASIAKMRSITKLEALKEGEQGKDILNAIEARIKQLDK